MPIFRFFFSRIRETRRVSEFFRKVWAKFAQYHPLVIVFALFAMIAGGIGIAVTPPLQGPDEDIHFVTCRQIACGDFSRTFPQSLALFQEEHRYLVAHPERKYSLDKWFKSMAYQSRPEEKLYAIQRITFYAALSYSVPAAGVFISSCFSDRYLPALYAGRFCCLLAYIILGCVALHILPFGKTVIFLLLMMPQSIFQAFVISYDGITNGAICLWGALLCRDLFDVGKKEVYFSKGLLLCSILLCFCKVPYMFVLSGLLLLFFMKNIQKKGRIWWPLGMMVAFLGFLIPLKYQLEKAPLPEGVEQFIRIMAPGQGAVDFLQERTALVWENILEIPQLVFGTLTNIDRFMIYTGSFAGCLGALDALLPPVLLVFYLLMILIFMQNTDNDLTLQGKFFFLVCGLMIAGMIFAVFAITYVPVNGMIPGITGRYFIPSAFLLSLALCGNRLKIKWLRRYENHTAVAVSAILLTSMLVTLLQRYYFEYWWDRTM